MGDGALQRVLDWNNACINFFPFHHPEDIAYGRGMKIAAAFTKSRFGSDVGIGVLWAKISDCQHLLNVSS
jgi:hypothetical protein